ncbi:MAG: CHAT domain-containing protein [Pirellulales bacterium]|nr:CHAT domain-containing protein [Pirellulales bacterium]
MKLDNRPKDRHAYMTYMIALVAIMMYFAVFPAEAVAAPRGRSVPSMGYHVAFRSFYDGEYQNALKSFRREGRGAIKNAQTRWIDSICYHTMCGECYYQMGQYGDALEHFDSAVKIYLAFSNWMTLVNFPANIRPAGPQRPVPWGQSKRRAQLGHYPESMLIRQGEVITEESLKRGGTFQQPVLFNIEVQEIVRCTALAIRRRAELLGPLSPHDQLTGELLTTLQRRPGLPNHWSEAWIDLQLGLAQMAAGKDAQARKSLERSIAAAGEYDHPMTSVALLELGKLAMSADDWDSAAKYFEEASYSAYYYPDPTIVEESLRYGALVHMAANRKGPYPPLANAIHFAKTKDYRPLYASLLLSAADTAANRGQTSQAVSFIEQAHAAFARRDMSTSRTAARLAFLQALVSFQNRKTADGNQALARSMEIMSRASLWLFHIGLADRNFTSGSITPRLAMELFEKVLRDPGPGDWTIQPMESMAVLTHSHPLPMEHWFEVAIGRKEHERAIEIADRCRRKRFFSTLAFGGRLESLRWILEGPQETLDRESQMHRQDLLLKHPGYEGLSKRAKQIREELRRLPPVPQTDSEESQQQRKLFTELWKISNAQEAVLREMAVGREPAGLIFPSLLKTEKVQAALPEGHALLVFFSTSRNSYAFLLNKDRYAHWRLQPTRLVAKQLAKLLQDMGLFSQIRDVTLKELADDAWKESARKLLETILKGSKADFSKQFQELIVVPDGIFWHVPFEALQVRVDDKSHSLLSRFRIRYAPTVSLAVPDGRMRKAAGATGVVVGKLHPRGEETATQAAFEEMADVLTDTLALPKPPPAPSSLYRLLFDRLISLDDIQPPTAGPYSWSPLQIDRSSTSGSLQAWMNLPWGGPQTVILPGFHTAAENSLKGVKTSTAGSELFLSACGLMSSGVKTIVLSRWRTGGRTSFEIVREFAQELPHASPAEAWQRAALLAAESPVDVTAEPRVKQNIADAQVNAKHPFFWSGYLLIDSGVTPPKTAAVKEHMLEFKQPKEKKSKAEEPKPEEPEVEKPTTEQPKTEKPDTKEPPKKQEKDSA